MAQLRQDTGQLNNNNKTHFEVFIPVDEGGYVVVPQGAITTVWNKWGYNSDVDTANAEMIWAPGGNLSILTTANTLDVVSSNTEDANGNTGAETLVIYGIDENRDYQTEAITLDGTNTVTTTNLWLGINRISITSSGSSQRNEGDITATATEANTVQGYIPATEGSTQQAFFFVRAGHVGLLESLLINVVKIAAGTVPTVTIKGWVWNATTNTRVEIFRHIIDTGLENTLDINYKRPFVITEQSVFYLTAEKDYDNTSVSARFTIAEAQVIS